MQKNIFKVVLLLGAMVTVFSCYYEYPPEPSPFEPEDVSFNTHVLPIMVNKCGLTECHDGAKKPNLLAENAYRSLTSEGYINVTFPEESKLYKSIDVGVGGLIMPPSGALSQLEKDLILTWMAKGAPNINRFFQNI